MSTTAEQVPQTKSSGMLYEPGEMKPTDVLVGIGKNIQKVEQQIEKHPKQAAVVGLTLLGLAGAPSAVRAQDTTTTNPPGTPTETTTDLGIISPEAPVKGIEYYQSLSQKELADIEKKASRMKNDIGKDIPLSNTETHYQSNGLTVDEVIFPVILETPQIETETITDIYTGETKNIEVYTVPVLLQTDKKEYFVTKLILGTTNSIFDYSSFNTENYTAAGTQTSVNEAADEFMKRLVPGEQYVVLLSLVVPGKEQDIPNALKQMEERLGKERFALVSNEIALRFKYGQDVTAMAPLQDASVAMQKPDNSIKQKTTNPIGIVGSIHFYKHS